MVKLAATSLFAFDPKVHEMVAIFTGFGAGVERGSTNILGSAGQLGSAGFGRGGDNVSVNAATGNLIISRRDEFLSGVGPDAGVSRSYNSLIHTGDRDNGDQWQQSTTRRIFAIHGDVNTLGATAQRLGADGSVINYEYSERDGELAYWAIDGSGTHDRLDFDGTNWTWTDGDSLTQEIYRLAEETPGEYRLEELIDRSGQRLTYSYFDNSDRLERITTQNGEWIEYKWDVAKGHVTQIDTGSLDQENGNNPEVLTRVYYGYEDNGLFRLTSVTTDLSPVDEVRTPGDIYTISYEYVDATSNLISKISQTDGSELLIAYVDGRVATLTQKVARPDQTNSSADRVTSLTYHVGYTIVEHPDETTTRMDYDAGGRLLQITTTSPQPGALAQIRQFEYDADGNVIRVIEGEGSAPTTTAATGGLDVDTVEGGAVPPPPPVSYASTGRGDNALAGLELNPEPGHGLEDGTLPAGWSGWNRDESVWETVDGPYTEAGANNVSALALTNTEAPASGTDHNANANLAQSIDTLDGSKAYEYTFYFQRNTDSDFRFLAGPGNAPRDPVTNELVATFKNATNGAANFYPKL